MRYARWLRCSLVLLLVALVAPALCSGRALPGVDAAPEGARWVQFRTADGLPCDTVWAIAADREGGDVWLGTSHGASLYRDGRWFSYTPEHGLGGEWVAAVAVEGDGRIWFGTFGGGLTCFDGTHWQTYTTANSGLSSDWISALALGPEGRLWCGTWGHGVSLFQDGRWQSYTSGNSSLPTDYVTALAASPDGTLWVGLHGHGLARLQEGHWTLLAGAGGLSDAFVNALLVLPDGSLWAATAKGLDRFDANGKRLKTYTTAEGLPGDNVLALAYDEAGKALWVGTTQGAALLQGEQVSVYHSPDALAHDYVSAIAIAADGVWLASLSNGVARYGSGTAAAPRRLPVVLVHGWHGPASDRLEDSEFRFLAGWLREDGFPVYYAEGVSPQKTLHQNAAAIQSTIERARQETGAARVDIIAFSMGGLNTRAYVESALHSGEVDQVFILGTPQAGIHLWYPFLLREMQDWARDPSAVELTPEYAALFNDLHRNNLAVPYTLLVGDVRGENLPETLRSLPAGDALAEAGSALALEGPAVHKVLTDDVHAWSEQTILLGLPSFLWPRRTYDAYLRNRLRAGPVATLPGIAEKAAPEITIPEVPQHSPFYTGEIAPGQSITFTVPVDAAGETRFYLRGESGSLTFHLIDPTGRVVDQDTVGTRGEYLDLGLADFQSYLIHQAEPGEWQVVVGRPGGATGSVRFAGYAVLDTPLRLEVAAKPTFARLGESVAITASLQHSGQPLSGAEVVAEIGRPDGSVERLALADDGRHGDGSANDGVYGGRYLPTGSGGYHTLFVTARGEGYARTAECLFASSPGTAALTGTYSEQAEDADHDGRYEALVFQAEVEVRATGDYLLTATLADAAGQELARVVQPLTLSSGQQVASLRFPGRVIASAGSDGPYTIRRVMLLDETGAAVPLQEARDVLTTQPYRQQDWQP